MVASLREMRGIASLSLRAGRILRICSANGALAEQAGVRRAQLRQIYERRAPSGLPRTTAPGGTTSFRTCRGPSPSATPLSMGPAAPDVSVRLLGRIAGGHR